MVTNYEFISTIIANEDFDKLPELTQQSISQVANAILDYEPYRNKFFEALINKVGLQTINNFRSDKVFDIFEPLKLEYGDTVEEIFVDKINAINPNDDNYDQFQEFKADIKTIYHSIDRELVYPITISDKEFRKAMISTNGLQRLVDRLQATVTESRQQDRNIQLIAVLDKGYEDALETQKIEINGESEKDKALNLIKAIKDLSSTLQFNDTKYNKEGVNRNTPLTDQVLVINHKMVNLADTEILANTFNKSVFDFPMQVRQIKGFKDTKLVAVLVDRNAIKLGETFTNIDTTREAIKSYTNIFFKEEGFMSMSLFDNAVYFYLGGGLEDEEEDE